MRVLVLLASLVCSAAFAQPGNLNTNPHPGHLNVSARRSIFSLLPGGVPASLVCTNNLYGSLGETVTVVRASTRPCQCIGSITTLAANVPCIEAGGLSIYGIRTDQTAADVITVPTTGWPTISGKVCVGYVPALASATETWIDARNSPGGWRLGRTAGGGVFFGSTLAVTAAQTWTPGARYVVCAEWDGASLRITRNEALIYSGTLSVLSAPLAAAATIGNNVSGTEQSSGLFTIEGVWR